MDCPPKLKKASQNAPSNSGLTPRRADYAFGLRELLRIGSASFFLLSCTRSARPDHVRSQRYCGVRRWLRSISSIARRRRVLFLPPSLWQSFVQAGKYLLLSVHTPGSEILPTWLRSRSLI